MIIILKIILDPLIINLLIHKFYLIKNKFKCKIMLQNKVSVLDIICLALMFVWQKNVQTHYCVLNVVFF
jgi:hypothetical protein